MENEQKQDGAGTDGAASAVERSVMPLPCPFCGNREITVIEGSTFRWRRVECNYCGAQGPEARVQTTGEGTPIQWEKEGANDAIKEWNTRATLNYAA